MTQAGAYTLYGRQGSGSVAPQIIMEELDLPYAIIWVGKDEAAQQAYAKICPTCKVPTLILPDGTSMIESAAMVIHLLASNPASDLAPQVGSAAHARFLQWMVFLSANLYEAALRIYYSARYSTEGEAHASGIHAQALADFERHIGVVEAALSPYLLGASVSAADIYLYMLATWYPDGAGALAAKFPKLGTLIKSVEARPAVAKVMAENA